MAGTPLRFSFSPQTDVFDMAYVPNHRVHAPTLIFVPTQVHYRHGYCARTHRGQRDVGPGERPARGAQRPQGAG